MKYAMKILSVAVVGTAFMGPGVGAASCNGSITLTGPDSTNIINCNEVSDIVLTCQNNVVVGTANTQTGSSGSGSIIDNTFSGNVATGGVVNENGQNITIGSSCDQLANELDEADGQGGVLTETPAGGQGAFNPEVLPNTSIPSNTPIILAITTAASVGTLGVVRILVPVYDKIKS